MGQRPLHDGSVCGTLAGQHDLAVVMLWSARPRLLMEALQVLKTCIVPDESLRAAELHDEGFDFRILPYAVFWPWGGRQSP